MTAPKDDDARLLIWRCARCGDTYPAPESEVARCPSCGAEAADLAHEPLL